MKASQRWLAIGSLVVTVAGCSGDTEVARNSGDQMATPSSTSDGTDTTKEDARKVLAAALATAKQQDQRVLVHVGAPW